MKQFVPRKQEKEVISIRLSRKLIKTIDDAAAAVGISRNEFINQCIEFALENMSSQDK